MNSGKKNNLILFIHGFTGSKDTWESTALEKRIPSYLKENPDIAANFDFDYFEYHTELIDELNGFKWLVNLGLQFIPIIGKRLKYSQYKKNLPLDKIKELLVTEINFRHQEYDQIVLIAHSYGGLVAKSAVLKLIELNSEKISAYITLATPHFGTDGAKLASEFLRGYNLKNSQLADMKPLSEILMSLTHQWLKQMNKLPISLYCLGFQDNIVPDISAIPFDTREGVLPVPSNHDHLSILIPTDKKDSILIAIQNTILESLKPKSEKVNSIIKTETPLKVEIVSENRTTPQNKTMDEKAAGDIIDLSTTNDHPIESNIQLAKNAIHNSTIAAGGNIEIGDRTIYTETETSRRIRLYIFVFFPLLLIAMGIGYFQYLRLTEPMTLTVFVSDSTPNPNIPLDKIKVTMAYGSEIKTQIVDKEATFKEIPTRFRNEPINIKCEAEGFLSSQINFILSENSVTLPMKRDSSLGIVFGSVKDESGNPIDSANVCVQDISVLSNASGFYKLVIPFHKQLNTQRVKVFKDGFKIWDFETPVIPNVPVEVVLIK